MEVERLTQILADGLAHDYLDVDGDGEHFQATIVSKLFRGKSLLQRHQMVYQVLGELLREELHAIALKTVTPEEWKQ